ncbi:hypothetical protein O181_057715 [Austropuccinia psidii MF-1]|uniref:Reverse transcriptase domain-containing protein n=1 Tax=Austropuccinia psidii MF-1 TaxID=1389203 RepID=A0A9Q3EF55_9BASI|nr:hypothetical protein [Austropuccinia psidii MF-1]
MISIVYVDNVKHLLAATSLIKGLEALERALACSQCWGVRHRARFDQKKTNLMLFTKKKDHSTPIQIGDQSLSFQKKVKWLGMTITFGEHLKNFKQCVNGTITQITRIIHPTFGLNQKEARKLVLKVLIIQIIHGSILWYTKKNKRTITRLLNTSQHTATFLSIGMMRQTPTAFLKHYGNIPYFTNQQIMLTQNYIHNKLTGPTEDPTTKLIRVGLRSTPPSHPSPLNLILNKENLLKSHQTRIETILTLTIPPWAKPIAPINNISLTKEQAKQILLHQVDEEICKGTLVFLSDGSLLACLGRGVAKTLVNTGKEIRAYFGKYTLITNFETKLMALILFQKLLQNNIKTHRNPTSAAFFSDSQMALSSAALVTKN